MDNDASGKMLKLNKLYFVLEKSNLVSHQGIDAVMGIPQNIWKLNVPVYLDVLQRRNNIDSLHSL
jgi:hypothetical protein